MVIWVLSEALLLAAFHKKADWAGTWWTRLRTNHRPVVLKIGLILTWQKRPAKYNFTIEPISFFIPD